jgi:hypothetical protein
MTTKADFTETEWVRLERAPFVAGMAISLADPGGPIEALKETSAAFKTVTGAAESGSSSELVDAVTRQVAADVKERKNPLSGFRPKGATAGIEILDELREVNRIVTEKASAEDAEAFRALLLQAAKAAADAAKEGGFMGFKAERVSEGEQRMLDQLGEVLR